MSARSRVAARLSGVVGADELDAVETRLASLEVAVAENVALEEPLVRLVSDLERAVAGVAQRSPGPEVGR